MLMGIASSPGVGKGRAYILHRPTHGVPRHLVEQVGPQIERYEMAIADFIKKTTLLGQQLERAAGVGGILQAQVEIVQDPELETAVRRRIEKGKVNVEYAVYSVLDGYRSLFGSMSDKLMQARAADFEDIQTQLLQILGKRPSFCFQAIPQHAVVVALDLSPSQAACFSLTSIAGVATQGGNEYTHSSIILRALGIPAVVSVNYLLQQVAEGDSLVVDGTLGKVYSSVGAHMPSQPQFGFGTSQGPPALL